jgi:hypothetical protein
VVATVEKAIACVEIAKALRTNALKQEAVFAHHKV